MSDIIVITLVGDGTATVRFAYRPDYVDAVKMVPGRRYDKDGRTWRIPADMVDILRGSLPGAQFRITDLNGRTTDRFGGSWADELLARCDSQLRSRVFRALTKVLHPDAGGDGALMTDLNVAHTKAAGRG